MGMRAIVIAKYSLSYCVCIVHVLCVWVAKSQETCITKSSKRFRYIQAFAICKHGEK